MAKKKYLTQEEEKQIKIHKLIKFYESAKNELNLDGDVNNQVHILVNACDELMSEICSKADDIKISDLEKIQEITPIDKKTYMDFVKICLLKNNDKLKDKTIGNFEDDFYKRLFITNIRHSFLESYINGNELKITDECNEKFAPFVDYESQEFLKIMEDSAKKQEYLYVLWKKYKEYAKAAEYITQLELTYKDFKNLVDWQHYKDGCYPSPNSPSKIWAIFDKFDYAHRTLTKWGYNDVSDKLKHEFGLEVNETTPHPIKHPWMKDEDDEKEID